MSRGMLSVMVTAERAMLWQCHDNGKWAARASRQTPGL